MTALNLTQVSTAIRVRAPDAFERTAKEYHAEQRARLLELQSVANEDANKARQLARHYVDDVNTPVKMGRLLDAWCFLHPEAAHDEAIPFIDLLRLSTLLDMWTVELGLEDGRAGVRLADVKRRLPAERLRNTARDLLAGDVAVVLGDLRPDEIANFIETEPKV